MLRLIEVELGDLKKMGGEISRLLEIKLRTEVAVKGSKLIVSEDKNDPQPRVKEVKMEVKRVLHHLGLSHYRPVEEHHRILIVRLKEKPKLPHRKERITSATITIPTVLVPLSHIQKTVEFCANSNNKNGVSPGGPHPILNTHKYRGRK